MSGGAWQAGPNPSAAPYAGLPQRARSRAGALSCAAAARPCSRRDAAHATARTQQLLRSRLQRLRLGGLLQRGELLARRGLADVAGLRACDVRARFAPI